MIDAHIREQLQSIAVTLPRFPDGRIDYSHAQTSLILVCFVLYGEEFLLLHRSELVHQYKRKWNTVAGYIDEPKPLREKVFEELSEELGITEVDVLSFEIGTPHEQADASLKKQWIVYPCIVRLTHKPAIRLDWEHTDFAWITEKQLQFYDLVPNLYESFQHARRSSDL
jgi:8-oxo-dGTP pyrophosphatase MutT (NUDIX family)